VARKGAGPGAAAAAAEARTVDTLGRRIERQAKSSPVSFQVAVHAGRECLGHVLARGKTGFKAFDRDDRSVETFPTQSAAAASFGGER
jgi:hypothetical protein